MLGYKIGIEYEDEVVFYVDLVKRQLVDSDHPSNIIPLSSMNDKGTHYEFYYDKSLRNIAQGNPQADTKTVYKTTIDPLTQLHPVAFANQYGVDLTDTQGKTDREFFKSLPEIRARQRVKVLAETDNDLLQMRLSGHLPLIMIGQEDYMVDWEEKMLVKASDPAITIELARTEWNAGAVDYSCLYDLELGAPVYGQVAGTQASRLARINIPDEVILDPVGVARQRGFGDTDLLYKYPIQAKLKAELVQLPVQGQKVTVPLQRQESIRYQISGRTNRRKGRKL